MYCQKCYILNISLVLDWKEVPEKFLWKLKQLEGRFVEMQFLHVFGCTTFWAIFVICLVQSVGSSRNQKKCVVCLALLVHAGIIVLRFPAYPLSGLAIASLWVRLLVCYGITGCELTQKGHCLALFRSVCDKRQLSRKNKFDKFSGISPALVFVAFWAPNFA